MYLTGCRTLSLSKGKCSANGYMLGLIGLLVFTMSKNLLNASTAVFLELCMYMSSGLYSSRINLHLMTLSALNVL